MKIFQEILHEKFHMNGPSNKEKRFLSSAPLQHDFFASLSYEKQEKIVVIESGPRLHFSILH